MSKFEKVFGMSVSKGIRLGFLSIIFMLTIMAADTLPWYVILLGTVFPFIAGYFVVKVN